MIGILFGLIADKLQFYQELRMYISNNKFRLAPVTQDNLLEASTLLTEQFLANNEVWKALNLTKEEALTFMIEKTRELLAWQQELRDDGLMAKDAFINYVYLNERDEIIAVLTHCQLTQQINKTSQVKCDKFKVLESYGKALEKNIYPKDLVPGTNLYGIFTAIKPEYAGSGVLMLFWFDCTHYMHSIGFRFIYSRASSPKSFAHLARYGADLIGETEGIENGKPVKFWWTRWWLRPISVLQHHVDKFIEKAKM